MSACRASIVADFNSVLSEVTVDEYSFRVTTHPLSENACVLWLQLTDRSDGFEPLGKFSAFNKRHVIEFIARYITSPDLRREVERKRFAAKVQTLSPSFLQGLSCLSPWQQKTAFGHLFNLDSVIEQPPLEAKRRIMAKRFHPDAGGDNRSMAVINKAYDYVSRRACDR